MVAFKREFHRQREQAIELPAPLSILIYKYFSEVSVFRQLMTRLCRQHSIHNAMGSVLSPRSITMGLKLSEARTSFLRGVVLCRVRALDIVVVRVLAAKHRT
jgi:hypothetical protein